MTKNEERRVNVQKNGKLRRKVVGRGKEEEKAKERKKRKGNEEKKKSGQNK